MHLGQPTASIGGTSTWQMDHYCCYRAYVTNTRVECNSDPVDFFLKHTKVPCIAAIDATTAAAQQLVTSLSNLKPNTALEKVGRRKLAVLRILAQIFQHTVALNKPRYEAPNHTVKPRVEASNQRVHKQLSPIITTTPTHWYPNRRTHAANLIGVIDDTKFQDGIPGHVSGHADDTAPQFANTVIDNETGEAL